MHYYYSWKLVEPMDSEVLDGWLAAGNKWTTLGRATATWLEIVEYPCQVAGGWQNIMSKLPSGIKIENSWNNEWQSFNPEGPPLIWEAGNRHLMELNRRSAKIYTYRGVVTGCAMVLLERKLQWGYVDSRLNTSLYCALSIHKGNCTGMGRNMATEERLLFPSTQLRRGWTWNTVLTFWTPQFMSDVKKIGNDQWQATKVFKALLQGGVEVLSLVKGRLRETI